MRGWNSIAATPAVFRSITGEVVPEPVFTEEDYRRRILEPMYRDIAPLDPAGVLRHEWLNSRAAIARFERGAIEIRVLDVQECPRADLAICAAAAAVLRALVAERWAPLARQQAATTESLQEILFSSIHDGDRAAIPSEGYLDLLGFPQRRCTAGELWRHLAESVGLMAACSAWREPLDVILRQGPLSRRILRAVGSAPTRRRLWETYANLSECLAAGVMFVPQEQGPG